MEVIFLVTRQVLMPGPSQVKVALLEAVVLIASRGRPGPMLFMLWQPVGSGQRILDLPGWPGLTGFYILFCTFTYLSIMSEKETGTGCQMFV